MYAKTAKRESLIAKEIVRVASKQKLRSRKFLSKLFFCEILRPFRDRVMKSTYDTRKKWRSNEPLQGLLLSNTRDIQIWCVFFFPTAKFCDSERVSAKLRHKTQLTASSFVSARSMRQGPKWAAFFFRVHLTRKYAFPLLTAKCPFFPRPQRRRIPNIYKNLR